MPIQTAPTDLTIQQRAAAELVADLQQGAAHIGVIAEDGVVTLTGYVATYLDCQAAERAVFRSQHVLGVINHLETDLSALHSHGDAGIARSDHALQTSRLTHEHTVRVTVEQDVVTLGGQVERAAQSGAGVSRTPERRGAGDQPPDHRCGPCRCPAEDRALVTGVAEWQSGVPLKSRCPPAGRRTRAARR